MPPPMMTMFLGVETVIFRVARESMVSPVFCELMCFDDEKLFRRFICGVGGNPPLLNAVLAPHLPDPR